MRNDVDKARSDSRHTLLEVNARKATADYGLLERKPPPTSLAALSRGCVRRQRGAGDHLRDQESLSVEGTHP